MLKTKITKHLGNITLVFLIVLVSLIEVLVLIQLNYTIQLQNTSLPVATGNISEISILKEQARIGKSSKFFSTTSLTETYKIKLDKENTEYLWEFSYGDKRKEEVILQLLKSLQPEKDWFSHILNIRYCSNDCSYTSLYQSNEINTKEVSITYDPQLDTYKTYRALGLGIGTGEDLWTAHQSISADFWFLLFLSLVVGIMLLYLCNILRRSSKKSGKRYVYDEKNK